MYNRLVRVWVRKGILAQATMLLVLLRMALAFLPYLKVRHFVVQTSRPSKYMVDDVDGYQRHLVWAIQLAGRYLLGDKPCLPQALAMQWFLRRQDIKTSLNIGVRKDEHRGISAHAWVEKEGEVIIGGTMSPQQFERLRLVKS